MTGISTLGSAIGRINLLNNQVDLLNTLTVQLSTGRKTDNFAGLGNDILVSQRSRASIAQVDRYLDNIKGADRRIKQSLLAIEEFQAQAKNFAAALIQFSQESVHTDGDVIFYDDPLTPEVENIQVGVNSTESDVDFKTLQDFAANLFDFLGDILNTRETDRYLLGGADSLNQPYTDKGTLDAAVSSLITRWKDETLPAASNLTSTELVSALRSRTTTQDANAVTDTIIGYSSALSAGNVGKVFTRVNERSEIDYTVLANEDPFRDIMVALSFIKNGDLGPIADAYAEPYTPGDPTLADGAPGATLEEQKENFFAVFNELATMVNKALDDIDSVRYRLENARVRIAEISDSHTAEKAVLENAVDDVENVDINEVALRLNTLQLQIEASYRITAGVSQLSLVNFL